MLTHNSLSSEYFTEFNQKLYDKAWRKNLRADPQQVLQAENFSLPDDCKIIVVTNSKNTMYLPLGKPPAEMDDVLHLVSAAGPNCVGTGATLSTIGCLCDTASSALCLSSAGSANVGQ